MFRIDKASAAAVIPTPEAVGPVPNGYFTEGDAGSGVEATVVSADFLNAVQEEICKVIEQAGLVLNKTTRDQLSTVINGVKGSSIASASSIDLGAAQGSFVDITGTTTITALGTAQAGRRVKVRFTGALTLTHNGTSLILPGAGNITTAANDRAEFISLGSGNWLCFNYTKASGVPISYLTAPFSDGTAIVRGSSDSTKLLRLEADGISASNTRVWTAPDYDINFANAAFHANMATNQTIAHNTATKCQFDTENCDRNSWFDNATNYRFNPQVPGVFLIGGYVRYDSLNSAGHARSMLYLNGSLYNYVEARAEATNLAIMPMVWGLFQLNGTTDYVEFYTLHVATSGGGSENIVGGLSTTAFFGFHLPSV